MLLCQQRSILSKPCFFQWSEVNSLSRVRLFVTLWTVAGQAPLSVGFSRQEYWSECESWNIKKGERQRIDAFELWCWKRLLRVPWTAKRSNQSILKEINPEYSLEGLMLKLQYFSHLMQSQLLRKDPDAGKDCREEQKATTEDEMVGWHHQLSGHEFEQALGNGEGQGSLACCGTRGHKESDMTERLNNINNFQCGI